MTLYLVGPSLGTGRQRQTKRGGDVAIHNQPKTTAQQGRSAGSTPLKILSQYWAALR